MKFTKRNVSKLERIISDTFKELDERPLYALEYSDGHIELRIDGTLYEIVHNRIYESIGKEINDYLFQFDNIEFYTMSVIRFYK